MYCHLCNVAMLKCKEQQMIACVASVKRGEWKTFRCTFVNPGISWHSLFVRCKSHRVVPIPDYTESANPERCEGICIATRKLHAVTVQCMNEELRGVYFMCVVLLVQALVTTCCSEFLFIRFALSIAVGNVIFCALTGLTHLFFTEWRRVSDLSNMHFLDF